MHPLAATTGKALALRRDIGSESENPSFEVAMWFSYIRFAGFSLSTIISLSSLVRVSDGRTWPVNKALLSPEEEEDRVQTGNRKQEKENGDGKKKPLLLQVLVGDSSNQLSHLWTSAGTWAVNVKKVNDKFFLQKGWKKFVHDHDLKLCEFLVFDYAGNLGFYVDIYGRDGCKKKFVTAIREKGRRPHEEGHGNVIHRRSPRHHGKQNLPSIDPIKYEAIDTESETSMHPLATSTGETIPLQRNNSFNSEKPFFKIAIQNSYIRRGYIYLPRNFVKTHLTEQRATVTLRVLDGKTWPVKLAFEGERGKLGGGFMTFCRDNKLEVGDVCLCLD
ncbi:hypothetical protein PRUPE_7G144100 [Prunus persica]|uniref:TF-B3 domain-containing protein n=1 Tax=Prunus persica TaxID=3760 RepID=A0A251NBE4_PRUPE|nr:hypothetical protein PRUPE_7G144100 [Prunus persica]